MYTSVQIRDGGNCATRAKVRMYNVDRSSGGELHPHYSEEIVAIGTYRVTMYYNPTYK